MLFRSAELCEFVKWAEFDRVGVFRYSDEEGTGSFSQDAKVTKKDSAARHRKLMALQRPISRKRNRALIGQRVEVLVDGASDQHEYVLQGRHAGQAPDIDVENWPKDMAAGHDAQLERAVAEGLKQLAAEPVQRATKEPPPPLWGKRIKPPME